VVPTWQEARWVLLQHAVERKGPPVRIEVRTTKGDIRLLQLDLSRLTAADLDRDFLTGLGLVRYQPPLEPVIGEVVPGGAAERAGLRAGDVITAIDGQRIDSWRQVVTTVRSNPGVALAMELRRDGAPIPAISITPATIMEGERKIGRIGAAPRIDRDALADLMTEVRYGALTAVEKALRKTWDTSWFSLQMLGKMIVGEVSLKNLSGPITIADYAGQSAQSGLASYLLFLALISISLGVLNLLPIPPLDGGHLMYYLFEALKGSPASERAVDLGQRVGIALLLMLMAFAFYNDLTRLFAG
jgi:regulator of sigma E protease